MAVDVDGGAARCGVTSTGGLSDNTIVSRVSLPDTGCVANRTSLVPFFLFVGLSAWLPLPDDLLVTSPSTEPVTSEQGHDPQVTENKLSKRKIRTKIRFTRTSARIIESLVCMYPDFNDFGSK